VTSGFVYDGANFVQELDGATSSAPVKAHLLTGGIDQVYARLEGNDAPTATACSATRPTAP
jgi:hypothetical protein